MHSCMLCHLLTSVNMLHSAGLLNTDARPLGETHWSVPIDIMTPGMSLRSAPHGCEAESIISVHVFRDKHRWRAVVLPGLVLINRSPHSLLVALNSLPSPAADKPQIKVKLLRKEQDRPPDPTSKG